MVMDNDGNFVQGLQLTLSPSLANPTCTAVCVSECVSVCVCVCFRCAGKLPKLLFKDLFVFFFQEVTQMSTYHILGEENLCALWQINVSSVNAYIELAAQSACEGKEAFSQHFW